MNESIIQREDSITKKIYLLYSQALELHKLYYQTIFENESRILKYYLLPKKWLDNLKYKYNYSSIIQNINIVDCYDYNSFKEKILIDKINDKNNNFINEINTIENDLEKVSIPKYSINYPRNFVPIKPDILENLNKNLLYELIIGEKNIFIFDNDEKNKNKNIFICSMNPNENSEDISDFTINVDSILILKDKRKIKEKKKLIKFISENKGIKNYYKERKIDVNKIGEQIIYDNEEEEVGIFYQIKKDNEEYKTPDPFFEEYIERTFPQKKIKEDEKEGKDTVWALQKAFGTFKMINEKNDNDNKIIQKKEENNKKTKLITINGDIYYYLNKHEIRDNCIVSVFNENILNNNSYNNNNDFNGYQYNNDQ